MTEAEKIIDRVKDQIIVGHVQTINKMARELEEANKKLQKAMARLKLLQGIAALGCEE